MQYVKMMPPSMRDLYKQYKKSASVGGKTKKATKGAFGGKKADKV